MIAAEKAVLEGHRELSKSKRVHLWACAGDGVRPPKGPKPSKKRPQSGAVRAPTSIDRRMAARPRLEMISFSFEAFTEVIPTQKEGILTVLLEMSWEHQEGVLGESAALPAAEASVGRLGPLRVVVEKTSPKIPQELKAKGMLWWTGMRQELWLFGCLKRWSPTPLKVKRPKSAR